VACSITDVVAATRGFVRVAIHLSYICQVLSTSVQVSWSLQIGGRNLAIPITLAVGFYIQACTTVQAVIAFRQNGMDQLVKAANLRVT